MRPEFVWSRHALSIVVCGVIALALPAHAQESTVQTTKGAEATTACERKVRQTLAVQAAPPAEVAFNAAPAEQPNLAGDGLIVLRGDGRMRVASGMRRFSYSCNVDPRTAEVVGVVMRDSTPVAVKAAPPRRTAEPDVSHLSLAACESSVVQALKRRWPRVSQISFDSGTRIFRQDTADSGELHGRGRALPVQGAQPTLFGFDCEIDPRDGQVLATRLSG